MTMTLYVANLPAAARPADLWDLFLPHGRVAWAVVRRDRVGNGVTAGTLGHATRWNMCELDSPVPAIGVMCKRCEIRILWNRLDLQ